jgi:hypothetical protein
MVIVSDNTEIASGGCATQTHFPVMVLSTIEGARIVARHQVAECTSQSLCVNGG